MADDSDYLARHPVVTRTARFYAWERRGRGWEVFQYPIVLEPPFRPFEGYLPLPLPPPPDDGSRPTGWSLFFGQLFGMEEELPAEGAPVPAEDPEEPEPEWDASFAYPLYEFRVSVPQGTSVSWTDSASWLASLSECQEPIAFEIVADGPRIEVRVACRRDDLHLLLRQLEALFPEAIVTRVPESLALTWYNLEHPEPLVVEFGLAREFMMPLTRVRDFRSDPLTPLFGAFTEVAPGELAVFQVLFTPARKPWAESTLRAVTTPTDEPFFFDAPELTALAREKVREPLYAAAVRVGLSASTRNRAWEILRGVVGALGAFGSSHENELLPLSPEDGIDLVDDLLSRTSHRPGMLLSLSELVSLVHLPGESVRIAALHRGGARTKAPPTALLEAGVILGAGQDRGKGIAIRLPDSVRMRHTHIVGASGTGKSTLLIQLALQDIARGEGVAVVDPHGDLVDEILARVPEERLPDVILMDPSDEAYTIGWNLLHARSDLEKNLLASDLVAVFRRLSTSWGDQMTSVLGNAILAFLESDEGGTLQDLRRFLVDREFRSTFLRAVRDPEVAFYWQKEFPLLKGTPQAPILTRLDFFLRPKPIRRMVAARENFLDLRGIVDQGKILLVKLSQGLLGEENAALLGSLLTASFHQAAMSRQDLAPVARRRFFLYLDEFHHLATPSMAALFTGARKYRLGLTVAHQDLRQLESKDREIASAVLGNAATRIVFRVGEDDARDLVRGFAYFMAHDLVNLGVGEAIARVERAEHDFSLTTRALPTVPEVEGAERQEHVRRLMVERFGRVEPPAPREEAPSPLPVRPIPQLTPAVSPASQITAPQAPVRPTPPAPLGRGGAEHQYLQEFVQRCAEAKGFRAVIEEVVPGGHVDLALYSGNWSLACEISVTSTVEQEIGNVEKCLSAGFAMVAVISTKKKHLATLREAIEKRLPTEEAQRVLAITPEDLFAFLEDRTMPSAKEAVVGGYRVKVNYTTGDKGEQDRKRKTVSEILARSLKRLTENSRR